MVVETRLMSSSCLPTPSKPDYRAYKPPNKTPVSGKTGLSLTKISPSFRPLVLLNLSRCKSRYTVPGAFAWIVPLCLKYSNQIKHANVRVCHWNVSPEYPSLPLFAADSSPLPPNWLSLITLLSRCICFVHIPVHRLRLPSVLTSAAYLFCPGQRSYSTNHVCPPAPVKSLPAQICIAFDSDLSVAIKKRCPGDGRSRLGLG